MPLRDQAMKAIQTANMPYAEIAKASGVSAATISRIANGGNATADSYELILAAFPIKDPDDALNLLPTHCDRCRADQNAHNAALREDFNTRHAEMCAAYEKRIEDMKSLYEQRHEMHNAEKERLQDDKRRLQFRVRWLSFAFLALVAFLCVIVAVDAFNGHVGWFRYYAGSSNHGVLDEALQYIANILF